MTSFRGSVKRKSVFTERGGRSIKTVQYQEGENTVAPLATVINAVFNGRFNIRDGHFRIVKSDFVGWKRLERESITLVLLVDLSTSTFPFVRMFAEIINSLTAYFQMHKDRIGLISLQGTQACVMNHPTHNYRVVIKNLMALTIHGQSPLADGLQKALTMVRLERYRKPGSRSLVILISDCYPEPITSQFEDIFDEPAYREAVRAASLYRKTNTQLLIINPSFQGAGRSSSMPGERLSMLLAEESRGKLIRISHARHDAGEAYTAPTQGEIRQILTGIETLLGSKISSDMTRMQA